MLTDDFIVPAPKRLKVEKQPPVKQPTGSRLFAPFRTLGLVSSTPVPFTSVPLGTTTFQITTSIGRSIHTYDLRRGLSLVFLSRPQCPDTITATHAYRDRVLVAWGGRIPGASRGIWVVKRGNVVGELEIEDTVQQEIYSLLKFGNWIVGCGPSAVEVWRGETYEHYTTILAPQKNTSGAPNGFSACLCSLPTYLNKVLLGCQDGHVLIYNVSTGKLVYNVQPPNATCGSVTALAASPVVGVVAIAYADGHLVMTDIEDDVTLLQLRDSSNTQPISSISFRTDGLGAGDDGRQDGIMATSGIQGGEITFWDLNRGGKVVAVLRGAHTATSQSPMPGINKIEFLPGQAVLVSTGQDNALRSWIFDQVPFSPIPRPLHSRSGHAAPVSHIHMLPATSDGSEAAGKWLLSAGLDRSLWAFSLRKDSQNTELSQGNIRHKIKKFGSGLESSPTVEDFKAPPIVSLACSLNRDGGMGAVGGSVWSNTAAKSAEEASMTGWESIVTAHEGDCYARTWFWGRRKAGRWAFETRDQKPVTCVAITSCGTFALVGSAGGSLDMHNLQSGIHRQRFPAPLKAARATQFGVQHVNLDQHVELQRGHTDAITGIVVDSLNQYVISSSLDGTVVFWTFSSGHVHSRISINTALPTAMKYSPVSGLVSLACDDSCIRIIDVDTKKTVRELWGCTGQIYDHCFSHDSKWIVASSMDSVIRVFDLATGHLIDAVRTATCTNLAFSSSGEFLATAHAGSIGINLWSNKTLFKHVSIRQIDEDSGIIDLTNVKDFEPKSQLDIQDEIVDEVESVDQIGDHSTQRLAEQLNSALITLSSTPSSRWQTLLQIDAIRERNKPIQPLEKAKAAPFFLGLTSTQHLSKTLDDSMHSSLAPDSASIPDHEKSRVSRLSSFVPATTTMSRLLETFAKTGSNEPDPVIVYLTSLSPSATDLEIRSLTLAEMVPFVRALVARLEQRRDFELVNTWLSVFLRIHGEFVSNVDELKQAVLEFKQRMSNEQSRLSALVGLGRGVIDYLRSAR